MRNTISLAGTTEHRVPMADESGGGQNANESASTAMRPLAQLQSDLRDRPVDIEPLGLAGTQLLHTERLAGIGQLAAGVAHEINNPIGYVFSNLRTLATYVNDMLRVLDAIDTIGNIEDLRQLKLGLEYDYIREDVKSLIKESEEGMARVTKLITALKDFSHVEEEGFRRADLHEGIEAALSIANNEIKYRADVVTAYGELPELECNVVQINQVVLNLLMNAAHAMTDFGRITVRTGHEAAWVWFEIQDTGKGMERSVIEHMFDPFFTTKPVGKGTGLGLSLSYNIIRRHNGHIDVASTPGEGTRIKVWLPVEQAGSAPSSEIGNA